MSKKAGGGAYVVIDIMFQGERTLQVSEMDNYNTRNLVTANLWQY